MSILQGQAGLAAAGFLTVGVFTAMVVSGRVSVLVALIITPVLAGLLCGFGPALGPMAVEGLRQLAPIIVMITFAVFYFSLMLDAGLFAPVAARVVALTRDDPVRVTVGTALLALVLAFSGDGISTGLVVLAAFLPVYRRLGLDTAILGGITAYAVAVQNLSPWGGPTPRAAAALGVDPAAVFRSVLPSVAAGIAAVIVVAWWLGRGEGRRLAAAGPVLGTAAADPGATVAGGGDAARPKLIWANLLVTLALIAGLATSVLSPVLLFPIGCAVALVLNYPDLKSQRDRVAAHADNLASFVLLFFAAGIFTGILSGTGMIDAMAKVTVAALPEQVGRLLGPITAVASMPLTYFMPNDAFFFGALPVVAQTAGSYGLTAQQIAAASVLGQPVHVLSPLLPSLYVFSSLLGVEPGRYLRFALPWAVLVSVAMIVAALLFGPVPLVSPAR